VPKIMAASLWTKDARSCSSLTWISRVPLSRREPLHPLPYLRMA